MDITVKLGHKASEYLDQRGVGGADDRPDLDHLYGAALDFAAAYSADELVAQAAYSAYRACAHPAKRSNKQTVEYVFDGTPAVVHAALGIVVDYLREAVDNYRAGWGDTDPAARSEAVAAERAITKLHAAVRAIECELADARDVDPDLVHAIDARRVIARARQSVARAVWEQADEERQSEAVRLDRRVASILKADSVLPGKVLATFPEWVVRVTPAEKLALARVLGRYAADGALAGSTPLQYACGEALAGLGS